MGSHKNEAHNKADKKAAKTGMSMIQKRLEFLIAKKISISEALPRLSGFMYDEFYVPLDLRVKIREDGSYLALAKREYDITEQVLFSVGDTMMGALLGLDVVILKNRWRESVPWSPDRG